ncbi:MAG: NAD(P)/FAD-dependent oxidoreductase [Nannocystaceae bacterium]|nr:geranylgeranyl reductase family protein [bacterium]
MTLDLIVVGAGPAGAAAGVTAARAGARVLVVDRATFPRPKTCGDALSNRGAEVVDRLVGTSRAVESIPHAVVHGAVAVFPDGTRVRRGFGGHDGYIVPRDTFDALLRNQLEGAGAQVREGANVERLLHNGTDVVGALVDGERIFARAVIAADGPGSVGWRALGVPYRRGRGLAVAITAYYEDVDFGEDEGRTEHYFESDLRSGYGWAFPPVDGQSNVGVYQRADAFEDGPRKLGAWLDVFIERHPERFAKAKQIGRTRTWSLPLASRPGPPGGPGLLLAGDAAFSIDPLSGEGIWQALDSGEQAARTVLAALDGQGLTMRWVRQHQANWTRRIGATSLVRLGIQDAMDRFIERGLYRSRIARGLLSRAYGSEAFEVSKKLK